MNKKIKVIELITGLERGGAERVVADMARLLPHDQFEVVVVSLKRIGPIGREIEWNCRVISMNARMATMPFVLVRLALFFMREKPTIVHTHLFHADILGRIAARAAGIKIIISTLHNVRYGGICREKLLGLTSSVVTSAVAVSQEVANEAARTGVMRSSKIRVIYNGIDMERFRGGDKARARTELGLERDDEILVNVGRMNEQKGHIYLLEAFAVVRTSHPRAKLILVGEGPLRESLEKRVQGLGIADSVLFLGGRDDVPGILDASDLFVFSSLWEGFALALAEAMACGKIVVSTRVAGVSEIVREGVSGFLVESKNVPQLAGAIEKALSLSPLERKKMEESATAIVQERFSVQKMVKDYQNLYEESTRTTH